MSRTWKKRALFLTSCLALACATGPAAAQDDAPPPDAQPAARGVPLGAAVQINNADDARALQATLPIPGRCVPPPPDMDAWYPFDGNGNDLILGKNAVVSGPVGWPGAVVSRGMQFLSPATVATVAPGPVLNQGYGDFSIDFWLFVPRQWTATAHPVRTLIEKRTSAGGVTGYSVFLYNSRLGLQLASGGHTNYGGGSPPLTAGWNHVAITVDRDDPRGIVFYRNASVTGTGNPTAYQLRNLDNTAPVLFGRNAFGDGGPSTGAILDEVEFFDRVLRPGEVRDIFGAGRAGKCKPRR